MRNLYYSFLCVLIILALLGVTLYVLSFRVVIKIDTNLIGIVEAIVTTLGILLALFHREILGKIFYPNIQIVGWKANLQTPQPTINAPTSGQTRLLIANNGKAPAYDVEIQVTKITDPQGVIREDFLPVPLSWTHDGRARRKLHINQRCYIDLCRRDDISKQVEGPKLVLAAGMGVFNYEVICEGISKLELTIFERLGIKTYEILISYTLNEPVVRVDSIALVS